MAEPMRVGLIDSESDYALHDGPSDTKKFDILNDSDEEEKDVPVYERKQFPLIIAFAFIFAMNAGIINAVTLLATSGMGYPPFTSSHHTGTATRMGIHISRAFRGGLQGQSPSQAPPYDSDECLNWFLLMFFFALGSAVPGFFIRSEKFHANRKYGLILIIEGVFLIITSIVIAEFAGRRTGYTECMLTFNSLPECAYRETAVRLACLGSFACGIQNALCTNLTGAVVRTTHVSGLLTDLGMLCGSTLRYFVARRTDAPVPEFWRFKVWLAIYIGFITGCALGTSGFDDENLGPYVIDFTATFLIAFGIYWVVKRVNRSLRADGGITGRISSKLKNSVATR
jgi:uncharacterized membrane protein YoaK (UPF0700 family)